MRRFFRSGLLHLIVGTTAYLILLQGCARPVLQTSPASDQEIHRVTSVFAQHRELCQADYDCCLDAEADATVSVSGWFSNHAAKLTGYLQAMEPGFIKYVALNPLGQPFLILVTDGRVFKSLNIPEGKAYIGSVHSDAFNRFMPSGFDPGFSYYWLTGRMQPGDIQVRKVMRDREKDAYWLQIYHMNHGTESMVLFDPVELVVLRHILLDAEGKHLADVTYAEYQTGSDRKEYAAGRYQSLDQGGSAGQDQCNIPGRISVSSKSGARGIDLSLHSFLGGARFSAEDFKVEIPQNFEQLFVK